MTTKTSYATTVYVPPSADRVHPTDDSQPLMEPPAAARTHDARGASAFADWYTRWILYGYVVKTPDPVTKYSDDCAQCKRAALNISQLISQKQEFVGDIFAVAVASVDSYTSAMARVIVKWSNGGYKIVAPDESVVHEFSGGDGYYLFTAVWVDGMWRTRQIATVSS